MKKLLIMFVLTSGICHADENYCHDAAKIAVWEGLIARHPTESPYIKLYALRFGLCAAVDAGRISLDSAIDVFEVERKKVAAELLPQKDDGGA